MKIKEVRKNVFRKEPVFTGTELLILMLGICITLLCLCLVWGV